MKVFAVFSILILSASSMALADGKKPDRQTSSEKMGTESIVNSEVQIDWHQSFSFSGNYVFRVVDKKNKVACYKLGDSQNNALSCVYVPDLKSEK